MNNTMIKDNKAKNFEPNPKQKACIENISGKYLVLAGPGTGKTFTVARRIKNIIEKGCEPDRILCLTYTDAAAEEMGGKLKAAMEDDNLNVNIFTFHGFCMDIIQNHSEEFELEDDTKLITEAVSRILIKECIDEINPEYFVTQNGGRYYFIGTILKGIEEIKKHNLSYEEFMENLENVDLEENKYNKLLELWKFHTLYKEKMQNRKYIDFSDMIIKVLEKFKDETFLKEIASEFDYILVDEYQDTSPVQNQIIYALGKFCENIFAVGDDDQTIYSFQGAKASTMQDYINTFNLEENQVICLKENMRSTQNILDVSREVAKCQQNYGDYLEKISSNNSKKQRAQEYEAIYVPLEAHKNFRKYKIDKDLTAKNEKLENKAVECVVYKNDIQEKNEIVKRIKTLINNGVKLSDIAILGKTNDGLREYQALLKRNNIDSELKKGVNIFDIPSVNVLLMYLGLLVNLELYSDRFLSYLLSAPFEISGQDFETIHKKRANYKTFIDIMKNETFVNDDKIKKFVEVYENLKSYKDGVDIKQTILQAMSETGILDCYSTLAIGAVDNIAGLKKVADEAENYQKFCNDLNKTSTLADFVNYMKNLSDGSAKILTDVLEYKKDAVQLSTYHSSKGREFAYVFMPALNRKKWETAGGGNKIKVPIKEDKIIQLKLYSVKYGYEKEWIEKENKFMEAAKLMFVGMTRAKCGLYLSYLEDEEKSHFISVIEEKFESKENIFNFKNLAEDYAEIDEVNNFLRSTKYNYSSDFKGLIDFKLNNIKHFSPSSLNSCLECRKKFFYEKILGLKPNMENADHMHYGNAVHYACDKFVKHIAEDNHKIPLSREEFFNYFVEAMNNMPFEPDNKKELLSKGEIVLIKGKEKSNAFYDILVSTDINNFYKSEYPVELTIDGENFETKIDRIDKDNDGNYIIYDYKTGNKKSEKSISPDGEYFNYYNQIAFYKYIFCTTQNIDFDNVRTIFLFPDCDGELEICLTKGNCEDVKDKYMDVIQKIRNHNFKSEGHKEKACEYCANKAFCNGEML